MQYVLGVDGGGTHTRVALASLEGELLAQARGGPGRVEVGAQAMRDNLLAARASALRAAGLSDRPARAACVGLAGVGHAERRAEARALLVEMGIAGEAQLELVPDFTIAHAGAFARGPGLIAIVGTGSVVFGRDPHGRTARAGGHGAVRGDPLSATWITREWLRHGRTFAGRSTDAVAESEGTLAELAPWVTKAAAEGDAIARAILEAGAQKLASQVAAVASELEQSTPEVAVVGGVLRAGPVLVEALHQALTEALPAHHRRAPLLPPLGGAVLSALVSVHGPSAWRHTDKLRACLTE